MSRHNRLLLLLLIVVPSFASTALSQTTPVRSQFVVRKGKDTVAIEIFTRDATTLASEIYQSNGIRTQYTADLRPDSSIRHVEMSRQNRQGGGATISVTFSDSIVSAVFSAGGDTEKFDFAPRGRATPFLAASFALAEQIVFANHLPVGKTAKLVAVRLGAGDSTTLTLERFHRDSVSLVMADLQLKVALSPTGEVIGGRNLGQDWLVERKPMSAKP
jgi:hypothetical protein